MIMTDLLLYLHLYVQSVEYMYRLNARIKPGFKLYLVSFTI